MKESQFQALCYAACVFLFALGHTKIQGLCFITRVMVTYGKFVPVMLSMPFLLRRLRFNIKLIGVMLFLGLLLLLNFFVHDLSYTIFFIAFFMIACSNTEPRQVYKNYAIAVFVVIVSTLALTYMGILVNDNSWEGRYDLGFTYCTFGPNLFLSACIALVGWKKEKVGWSGWLFVLLLNQFFYEKTSTDAVYLCVLLLFIGGLFLKSSHANAYLEKSRTSRFIFSHSAVIFAILTIALQIYYNSHSTNATMIWLNRKVSNRLIMGMRVFSRYSTGGSFVKELLFGLKPELATYLDSSYLAILTQYGVLLLLVFCFLMDTLGKRAYEGKDYYVAICVIIFMLHCITDPQLSSFRCNPLIITVLFYIRTYRYRFSTNQEQECGC